MKATSSRTNHQRRSPGTAGWWGRLLVTVLFGIYVNYVPIHLATATHLNDLLAPAAEIASHHEGHAEGEDHGHADDHLPHPTSDHNLNFTAQTQALSNAPVLAVACVLANASVLNEAPRNQQRIPVLKRIKPPGESPPGPLLPRAPPLA